MHIPNLKCCKVVLAIELTKHIYNIYLQLLNKGYQLLDKIYIWTKEE